jgi:Ca2+/Na+ antiporter
MNFLLFLQDKSADVFFEKIGEAAGAVFFIILLIAGIVWLVKKAKQK